MNSKNEWFKWINDLDDKELLHILDKKYMTKDVPEKLDYKLIHTINSQRRTPDPVKRKIKFSDFFKFNNPFTRYAYTFSLVLILFLTGIFMFFYLHQNSIMTVLYHQ